MSIHGPAVCALFTLFPDGVIGESILNLSRPLLTKKVDGLLLYVISLLVHIYCLTLIIYVQVEQLSTSAPATKVTPPTPRSKKYRHVAGKRAIPRHRKAPSRSQAYTPPRSASPVQQPPVHLEYSSEVPVPEPALDEPEEAVEVEEQVSLKLYNLINSVLITMICRWIG